MLRCLGLLAVLGACLTNKTATPAYNFTQPVTGLVFAPSFDPNAAQALNGVPLTVKAFDPQTMLATSTAAPLASATLAEPCNPVAGCPYNLAAFNMSKLSLALLIGVDSASDPSYVSTLTWAADGNAINQAIDGNTRLAGANSALLSANVWPSLAAVTGLSVQTLQSRGVMLGQVLGNANDQLPNTPLPAPIAGATVNTDAAAQLSLYYANEAFTGPATTAATSANGVFVAVPNAASPVINVWRVTPAAGDTHVWLQVPTGGMFPNMLTFLYMAAS